MRTDTQRILGSQLREGANAEQHIPTLSVPPLHHCLNGKVYRGNRHHNVCKHVHCTKWYCPRTNAYTDLTHNRVSIRVNAVKVVIID